MLPPGTSLFAIRMDNQAALQKRELPGSGYDDLMGCTKDDQHACLPP